MSRDTYDTVRETHMTRPGAHPCLVCQVEAVARGKRENAADIEAQVPCVYVPWCAPVCAYA